MTFAAGIALCVLFFAIWREPKPNLYYNWRIDEPRTSVRPCRRTPPAHYYQTERLPFLGLGGLARKSRVISSPARANPDSRTLLPMTMPCAVSSRAARRLARI
jgi:hypothetical protein